MHHVNQPPPCLFRVIDWHARGDDDTLTRAIWHTQWWVYSFIDFAGEKSDTRAFDLEKRKNEKIKVVIEDGGGQANRRETCRQVHRTAICLAHWLVAV